MINFDNIKARSYRRVNEGLPLLIEKGENEELSFIIETPPHVKFGVKKLRLNGINISERSRLGTIQFVLTLRNKADLDIFLRLCQDLSEIKKDGTDKKYADDISARLEQWVYFLSRSRRCEIPIKTQLGLLGELEFIKLLLANGFSVPDALECWRGPDRGIHDFVFNRNAHEIKSKLPDDKTITISSEGQLDATALEHLNISVFEFDEAKKDGKTVSEVAGEIIYQYMADSEELRSIFERKLLSLNFNVMETYENLINFEKNGAKHYHVTNDFPRIVSSSLPAGITGVEYKLNLDAVSGFIVPFDPNILR